MHKILIGLIFGLVIGAGGLVIWSNSSRPLTITSPTPTATEAAGVNNNFSESVNAASKFSLSLEASDRGSNSLSINPTNLVSLEITFAKAEITLDSTSAHGQVNPPRTEILNLTQPTIDLFALRGSGLTSQLGISELATGHYHNLKLTINTIKGWLNTGQTIDIPIDEGKKTITINQGFDWTESKIKKPLIIDFDTTAGLHQSSSGYDFAPILRGVTEGNPKES